MYLGLVLWNVAAGIKSFLEKEIVLVEIDLRLVIIAWEEKPFLLLGFYLIKIVLELIIFVFIYFLLFFIVLELFGAINHL